MTEVVRVVKRLCERLYIELYISHDGKQTRHFMLAWLMMNVMAFFPSQICT